VITARTGKRHPLDVESGPRGSAAIVGRTSIGVPMAIFLNRETLNRARALGVLDLYTSHFATCPDAADWRRTDDSEGEP
jgi:hypothetical protein